MIILKKDERYPDMCHICSSKKDTYLLKFEDYNGVGSTCVSVCKKCLLDLKEIIEKLED